MRAFRRVGVPVFMVGIGCALAAYAGEPSKQMDSQKKMQKNEQGMEDSGHQKNNPADLGSSRATPNDGMKSKPTRKGDTEQTDPLEQGGRSPATSRGSSTGAGQ